MKVNQIVSEHKKGFRAKKYASKPKNTIAPKKPEPIKPQGPIGAGDEKKVKEGATITKTDPTNGTEVTDTATGVKTTLPPDKAAALIPDAEKPGEFDLNTQAVAPAAGTTPGSGPQTPKVGSKVEIKTAESLDDELLEKMRTIAGLR